MRRGKSPSSSSAFARSLKKKPKKAVPYRTSLPENARRQLLSGLIRLSHVMNALRRIIFSSLTKAGSVEEPGRGAGSRGEKRRNPRLPKKKKKNIPGVHRSTRAFPSVLLLEHARREFPEERDERPRRGRHGLIPRAFVLREVLQQLRRHHQGAPQANLPHGVDADGDNLGPRPVVHLSSGSSASGGTSSWHAVAAEASSLVTSSWLGWT